MSGGAIAAMILAAAPAAPITSLDDLGAALTACIRGSAPDTGIALDLRFVLTARGALVGRPEAVSRNAAPMAAQRTVRAALLDALRRCTPFALAPEFARAIAGRPLTSHVLTGGRAVVV